MEIKNWTIPENGVIHVPDELDELFNQIGMQLRFHTISGAGEVETVARMVYKAQIFFTKKFENLKSALPEGAGA